MINLQEGSMQLHHMVENRMKTSDSIPSADFIDENKRNKQTK